MVGPLGRHPGWVVTQGEILAELFMAEGYQVVAVSRKRNRYHRLLDIIVTLIRRRGDFDLLVRDGDDEAMAAAIERLLKEPALAGRLSINGRKLAELSGREQVLQQWEQPFAELAAAPQQ